MPARIVSTLILLLFVAFAIPGPASAASGYGLSNPVSYENLSVYFVRGPSSNAQAPLTLQEASSKGLVRINELRNGSPTLDNLSDKPLFVPFGTLIKGGLQDQVVGTSLFVGPGATGIALPVFCVERGRSVKREGDDENAFAVTDALLPSRVAKLALLSGSSRTSATEQVRQIGLWLTIASIKQGFAAQLDSPIQSPRSATSLPLALEHPGVPLVQSPYVEALESTLPSDKNVVGAVFAVNGNLSSAEIYGSHALFKKMWPSLLRAYASEAAVSKEMASAELPSRLAALAFITNAERAVSTNRLDPSAAFARFENGDGIFAVSRSGKRGLTHKAYMAKPAVAATPMEAAVLRTLAENTVDGMFVHAAGRDQLPRMVSWLAQMTEDRDAAMQQATVARIIDPAPAPQAAPAIAASVVYPPLPDRSSDGKMPLLAFALLAVLSWLALRLGGACLKRMRAIMHALGARLGSQCARMARTLRELLEVPVYRYRWVPVNAGALRKS